MSYKQLMWVLEYICYIGDCFSVLTSIFYMHITSQGNMNNVIVCL